MLRNILRLAADLGTIRCEELARALDTSPELVRLALAELARRDYLQAVVPGCSTACEYCPSCRLPLSPSAADLDAHPQGCGMGGGTTYFVLTHVSCGGS